ncbi:ATP-binding protein [Streptomyces sp. NPDC005899]|uniref:ATP-binding protein n=1 Tax=Streptomyces sp. NPDC005899 TaxID=3155716 RepID=UPI0033CF16CA
MPYGSDAHHALLLTVGELSSKAVRHGHASGRNFRLRLSAEGTAVRIEVTDTRGECLPTPTHPAPPDQEGGRGLLLVPALADRRGWYLCADGPGKTVWAVLDVSPCS